MASTGEDRPDMTEQKELIEAMPGPVESAVRSHMFAGESLLVAVGTDMLRDGMFGPGWFIATDRRLLAYDEDSADGIVQTSLADIRGLERRELPGCFQLQAITSDRAVTLAWYSGARCEPFDRAIAAVRPLIEEVAEEDETVQAGSVHKREGLICESCGKPIPRRVGVCPDCLDKRRLLLRLLRRIKPYRIPALAALLLLLLLTVVEMSQPLLIRILVDDVIPNGDLALFAWVIAGIVAIYAFGSLFTGMRSFLMAWFGQKVVYDLRAEL